jgi:hypothetical protein
MERVVQCGMTIGARCGTIDPDKGCCTRTLS